jgi:hypothetical protein
MNGWPRHSSKRLYKHVCVFVFNYGSLRQDN